MRRSAWPFASVLLVLSACNALTGASELSVCTFCGTDAAADAPPDVSVGGGDSAVDAPDVAVLDAGGDADGGCQGTPDCPRVAFVTSKQYTGDLGGVAGADAKCQALADQSTNARIKGRTFVAWISSTATSPAMRFVRSTAPYIRADGPRIASNWNELIDGLLASGIFVDELGANQTGDAWTGTDTFGGGYAGDSCENWTSSSSFLAKGERGNIGGFGPGWSGSGTDDCDVLHNLYCFEK